PRSRRAALRGHHARDACGPDAQRRVMADDAAYQGVPGAFSEQAAREAVGHDAHLLPCATFEEVFDAVRDGRVRCAVVPVENELAGPVAPVVRLLAEREVEVTDELTLRIAQALIAAPGAT